MFVKILCPQIPVYHLCYLSKIQGEYIATVFFYLAHSALSFFKIALKMLNKIASQLAHYENECCLHKDVMAVFISVVISNVMIGNDELKL